MPEGLRPLDGRARWAVTALVACVLANVLAIGFDWLEIDLINRLLDGGNVTDDELSTSDARQRISGFTYLITLVATTVIFIRWFHAAYANLRALVQSELRFQPGWAIGGWFVPILNLWRPKQIADDVWRGSDPDAPVPSGSAWRDAAVPKFLAYWWAAWILSGLVGNVAGRAWFGTDTPEDLRSADQVDLAASVLAIIAAVLAILVVRRLTKRQNARVQRLAAAGTPVPTGS